MLQIDFKKTSAVSFRSPLGKYIKSKYSQPPSNYDEDLKLLDEIRVECVSSELSPSSINRFWKYYGQLTFLQSRFLIDEFNVKISFPWYTCYPKDKKSVSSYNLNFEKACVLFNLAILYSQLASIDTKSAEALKKSCSYFMTAAGILFYVQEHLVPTLNIPPYTDLSPQALSSFIKLMLAQAQECVVLKALIDGMKDAAISKLAASCGELYDAAFDAAADNIVSDHFGQGWMVYFQVKALYFYAIAQYRKSLDCCPQGKYGEEIVRLEQGLTYLTKATSFQKFVPPSLMNDIKNLENMIAKNLARAQKDNDLIYHDVLPNPASLVSVGRAEMVKPTPFPELSTLADVIGKPLFSGLIPLAIQQVGNTFEEKKSTLVTSILNEFSSRPSSIEKFLADSNLPGSIEAAEAPIGIPKSVILKSKEVKDLGGAVSLSTSLDTLESMRNSDEKLLNEIDSILAKEQKEDESMRSQFGDKWKRTKSSELNGNLLKQLNNLKSAFAEAGKSDRLVKTRYEQHLPFIESLSSSLEELETVVPVCKVESSIGHNNEHVKKLKLLLMEIENSKKKTINLIDELKKVSAEDHITNSLLGTTVGDNRDEIIEHALVKYSDYKQKFEDLVEEQKSLVESIKNENRLFLEEKTNSPALKQREVALQNLDNAYQNFKTLSSNFSEGITFYSDLQNILNKLKRDCEDFAFSRQLEFKDMLQEIQAVANQQKPVVPPRPDNSFASRPVQPEPQPFIPANIAQQPQQQQPVQSQKPEYFNSGYQQQSYQGEMKPSTSQYDYTQFQPYQAPTYTGSSFQPGNPVYQQGQSQTQFSNQQAPGYSQQPPQPVTGYNQQQYAAGFNQPHPGQYSQQQQPGQYPQHQTGQHYQQQPNQFSQGYGVDQFNQPPTLPPKQNQPYQGQFQGSDDVKPGAWDPSMPLNYQSYQAPKPN